MLPNPPAASPAAVTIQAPFDASTERATGPTDTTSTAGGSNAGAGSGTNDHSTGGAVGGVTVSDSSPAVTSGLPAPTPVVAMAGAVPRTSAAGTSGCAKLTDATGAVCGNTSTNTAIVSQAPDVTVVTQRPIVIVGATGDTTIDVMLGGVVRTTVTATATNTSNGNSGAQTAVEAQSVAGVRVTSGGPVTLNGVSSATATPVVANSSANQAVISQSPNVTVVESLPIVLLQPDGSVTIHAVIAGVVLTKVVGSASNSSAGNAVLVGSNGSAGPATPTIVSGNTSTSTVVVVQTPTITVVFEIPITIVAPQGPVQIQAVIAGVVDTQLVASGSNTSTGTADAMGSPGAVMAAADGSTNTIVLVQAPQVTLDEQIPITITDPAGPVAIDAATASTVTTTLDATAFNASNGTTETSTAAAAGDNGDDSVSIVQQPNVQVHSAIPVTITDPVGTPLVRTSIADVVQTVVRTATLPGTSTFAHVPSPDPANENVSAAEAEPSTPRPVTVSWRVEPARQAPVATPVAAATGAAPTQLVKRGDAPSMADHRAPQAAPAIAVPSRPAGWLGFAWPPSVLGPLAVVAWLALRRRQRTTE